MLCEKTPDCDKNMDEDGLDLEVNGDFISAKGILIIFKLSFLSEIKKIIAYFFFLI